eukprot:TRINITY_DN267_c0_g1_i2.p1 TRINITY_DN267_c0_g1~~TRINITY_DN267_c0_g1_i2.p1  ORF type:complete len:147 (-),score=17.03 TRINITY_DN267_c0_g1_i2:33-473(-)
MVFSCFFLVFFLIFFLDELRPLSYPGTDVFLLCFSTVSVVSLENVQAKWIPELQQEAPNSMYILVGTKTDLRNEYTQEGKPIVSTEDGQTHANRMRAQLYLECSALTQDGLSELFMASIRVVLSNDQNDGTRARASNNEKGCCIIL